MDFKALVEKLRGKFVVLDGPDGCGKSTQLELLAKALEAAGGSVVRCKDPGGTAIGDRIRSVLLDHDLSKMNVNCETLLFMASRAQLIAEVIAPALTARQIVLCDRFVTSTLAYQGAAGYAPERIIELAAFAIGERWPNLTIVLDLDTEAGLARVGRKPHHGGSHRRKTSGQAALFDDAVPDAMEARPIEFHRQVRGLFQQVDRCYPTPVRLLDGDADEDAVHARILECLADVTL
jgi:dTMP kinase